MWQCGFFKILSQSFHNFSLRRLSLARSRLIALFSLALAKLFSHKEWGVYLSNSAAHQTFDKRESFTVDEANVFQIKSEP